MALAHNYAFGTPIAGGFFYRTALTSEVSVGALRLCDWWEFRSQVLLDFAFKFLSACHTAGFGLTEGASTTWGLQLAAEVQYCGFWSVLKTVRAMADTGWTRP